MQKSKNQDGTHVFLRPHALKLLHPSKVKLVQAFQRQPTTYWGTNASHRTDDRSTSIENSVIHHLYHLWSCYASLTSDRELETERLTWSVSQLPKMSEVPPPVPPVDTQPPPPPPEDEFEDAFDAAFDDMRTRQAAGYSHNVSKRWIVPGGGKRRWATWKRNSYCMFKSTQRLAYPLQKRKHSEEELFKMKLQQYAF